MAPAAATALPAGADAPEPLPEPPSEPVTEVSSFEPGSFPITASELLASSGETSPTAVPRHPPGAAAGAQATAAALGPAATGHAADRPLQSLASAEPSTTLPHGMMSAADLSESMRQRHGWSAPWLPGLWRMPDSSTFGNRDAHSSLLLSLQLYFEKETGIDWKCPQGVASAQRALAARRAARATAVQIAERAVRERVHYIPGFSEATTRAIPSLNVWAQLAEGCASWERTWTDPYSSDSSKVIQVRPVAGGCPRPCACAAHTLRTGTTTVPAAACQARQRCRLQLANTLCVHHCPPRSVTVRCSVAMLQCRWP